MSLLATIRWMSGLASRGVGRFQGERGADDWGVSIGLFVPNGDQYRPLSWGCVGTDPHGTTGWRAMALLHQSHAQSACGDPGCIWRIQPAFLAACPRATDTRPGCLRDDYDIRDYGRAGDSAHDRGSGRKLGRSLRDACAADSLGEFRRLDRRSRAVLSQHLLAVRLAVGWGQRHAVLAGAAAQPPRGRQTLVEDFLAPRCFRLPGHRGSLRVSGGHVGNRAACLFHDHLPLRKGIW